MNIDGTPVDIVTTPYGKYLVVDYVKPDDKPDWRLSGRMPMLLSDDIPLYSIEGAKAVRRIMADHPNTLVGAYSRPIHFSTSSMDLPEGRLGDILSEENITATAQELRDADIRRDEENTDSRIHYSAVGELEDYIQGVRCRLALTAWGQLIKESAANLLPFTHDYSPSIMYERDSAFVLIDDGHENNCGYGASQVFFYQTVLADAETQSVGLFPRRTIYVSDPVRTWMKFLSEGEIASGENIWKDGVTSREFMLRGSPATIMIPREASQKNRLLSMLDDSDSPQSPRKTLC